MGDPRRTWAWEEFGSVEVDDARLKSRLISMGMRVAEGPSGTVAKVFWDLAERQAAYDFLSNGSVRPAQIVRSIAEATLNRSCDDEMFYVPIDGSSVTLSDPSQSKAL